METREFWQRVFIARMQREATSMSRVSALFADEAVEEYKQRFGGGFDQPRRTPKRKECP